MSLFNNQAGLSFAEDCFNIKANFLERDRVQLENRIEDLKEALRINKDMIKVLISSTDNLQVSLKLQDENKLLYDALERTQFERDEAQAKLLIAEQVRQEAERKETDAIREKKEFQHQFAEDKQLQEYRIQYLENQYKKLEVTVHEIAEKNPQIERRLRQARFEVPAVKKIANVITENEVLREELQEKKKEIEELNKELDRHIELLANKELQYRVDKFKEEREEQEKKNTIQTTSGKDPSFGNNSSAMAKNYCDTSFNARKGRLEVLKKVIIPNPRKPQKKLSQIPKLDLSQTRTGQALDKKSLFAYIDKLEKMNKYHILRITNLENDNLALDRQNQKLKAKLRQLNETSILNQTLNLSGIAPFTHQRSGTLLFERGDNTLMVGESAMTPRRHQQDLYGLVTYRGPPRYNRYSPFTGNQRYTGANQEKSQENMLSYLLGKTTLLQDISVELRDEMADFEDDDGDEYNNKPLSGQHYDEMNDQEYLQAVEERVQRGKGECLQAKQELLEALEEKE